MSDKKMSEYLWRDCKSDQERADFILCGRACETGVIAPSIQSEVAMAFQRLATLAAQPPCGADGVWRPIETAPLDGRAVLVMSDNWPGTKSGRAETCNGHNTYVAEWWAESNEWMCYMSLPCEPVCPIAPTHWMPLPDVPSSQPAAPVAPATVAVPAEVARSVQVLRAHNEWRRGNKTENWEPIPYSPAELGRAIDIVCDHATHTAKPDLLKRATDYAHDIVTWLHRDHYSENTRFEPFGDLLGLLSQIDNMICGWKEATPPVSADSAMLEEAVDAHRRIANDICDNVYTRESRAFLAKYDASKGEGGGT